MTDEALIGVALDAAEKKAPDKVPFELLLQASLKGQVDGPGIGSVPVEKGRVWAFFLRESASGNVLSGKELLLGELQRGNRLSIVPSVRVSEKGMIRTISVASVGPFVVEQTPNR
jgi:hypothetical protein